MRCSPLSVLRQCSRKPGTGPGFVPPFCGDEVPLPELPTLHSSVRPPRSLNLHLHLVVMSGSPPPHHGGVSRSWMEKSGLLSLLSGQEEESWCILSTTRPLQHRLAKTKHLTRIKNQQKLSLNERGNSTDANMEMTQILELSDKYFKANIFKMLQWVFMNIPETNENKLLRWSLYTTGFKDHQFGECGGR